MIVTLEPAISDSASLSDLLRAGVSVFRIDLSQIDRPSAEKAIYAIRSISAESGRPVALMLETGAAIVPDLADVRFGLESGVDWLAVSAGADGNAIRQLRQVLRAASRYNIGILARVETPVPPAALDDADGIILTPASATECQTVLDGWVCRGKSLVIAPAQKTALAAALAVQPDALLLGPEFKSGSSLAKEIRALEYSIRIQERVFGCAGLAVCALSTDYERMVALAMQDAFDSDAEALVIIAPSTDAPTLCASMRSRRFQTFVFTADTRLARRLRLHFGLEPLMLPFGSPFKGGLRAVENILRKRKLVQTGAKVVYITETAKQGQRSGSVEIRTMA